MSSSDFWLLHLTFFYSPADLAVAQQAAWERAHAIAQVNGLQWKIWIHHADRSEAGGIYLFTSETAAQAYLDGPIVAQIKQLPGADKFQATGYAVNAELSALTRAPLQQEGDRL